MSRHRNIRNISLDDGKFSVPNHFQKNVTFRNKTSILLFPVNGAKIYLPPITIVMQSITFYFVKLLLLYFTFVFQKQMVSGSPIKK